MGENMQGVAGLGIENGQTMHFVLEEGPRSIKEGLFGSGVYQGTRTIRHFIYKPNKTDSQLITKKSKQQCKRKTLDLTNHNHITQIDYSTLMKGHKNRRTSPLLDLMFFKFSDWSFG